MRLLSLQNSSPKRIDDVLFREDASSVFIDANVFIYHFSKGSRFNSSSSNFLERGESGAISGFTSSSIIQEVMHRSMIMEAAALFPKIAPRDLVRYLKAHPEEVKKLTNHQEIPSKFTSFNITIISSDLPLIKKSQIMKRRYGFLSNDALTLQIMEDMKIKNLASNDADFERVETITLYRPSVNTAFQK